MFIPSERSIIEQAISHHLRLDGRDPLQLRAVSFSFDRRGCLCRVGNDVVRAAVHATLEDPNESYGSPLQGRISLSVRPLSPFSEHAGASSSGKPHVAALLEALLKQGSVLDLDALCVLPRQLVWKVDIRLCVLSGGGVGNGGVDDACVWAAMAALRHFRRPDVSLVGDRCLVHPVAEREPVPLPLLQWPLTIHAVVVLSRPTRAEDDVVAARSNRAGPSFPLGGAVGARDAVLLLDPSPAEKDAAVSTIVVAMSRDGQLFRVSHRGALPLPFRLVQQCIQSVRKLIPQIVDQMDEALAAEERARRDARASKFEWAKTRDGVKRVAMKTARDELVEEVEAAPKKKAASDVKVGNFFGSWQ